jgi:hypothetical protein
LPSVYQTVRRPTSNAGWDMANAPDAVGLSGRDSVSG